MSSGIITAVIHAPSTNLATRTTRTVMPVAKAPKPVEKNRGESPRAPDTPPVHDHACLREREGEEGADGIERDEAVRDAAEDDEQNGCEGGEGVDAVGVEQTAAA